MTESAAQAFMQRIVVQFNTPSGTELAFQEDDQSNVLAGPGGHVHFIEPGDVVEVLTVAQIAAIAAGG